MRRLVRLVAVLGLLLSALVAAAATASAAGTSASVCAKATSYPPSTGAALSVSTTTPYRGERIEVGGTGYCPDEQVAITLAGQAAGTATTGADGSFAAPVAVAVAPGDRQLTGTGARGDSASVTLQVRPAGSSSGGLGVEPVSTHRGAGNGGAAPQSGGGGLALTGVDVALLVAVAAALLAGGGYLAYAGRRRHARG